MIHFWLNVKEGYVLYRCLMLVLQYDNCLHLSQFQMVAVFDSASEQTAWNHSMQVEHWIMLLIVTSMLAREVTIR